MSDIPSNLSLILLLALEGVALVLGLGLFLLKKSSLSGARWAWWVWSGLGAVALIGLILIVKESSALVDVSEKKQWTQTTGKILDSEMRGKKAYIPFVKYEYELNGKTYTAETELYSPQWGGKLLRKENSESILAMFKPESTVTVYVNPKNHADSALEILLGWDLFIRLGVGIFLWLVSTAILYFGAFKHLLHGSTFTPRQNAT
ncbi:MAG: DUF3592 domain-containing protein [Chloroherpetonaceae bacterium]